MMLNRSARMAALATVAGFLLAGCAPATSGPDSDPEPEPVPTTTEAGTVFDVEVEAGVLRGACEGVREPDSPAIILVPGLGNPGSQLSAFQDALSDAALVCTYDRPGVGASPPGTASSTFAGAVEDLESLLVGAEIAPPYILVGQSLGGAIALRYAQTHPNEVSGFVAMNPVPPATSYEARAATVETPEELQSEIDFYNGANDEGISLRSTDLILQEPFPATVPYVVMYAEDCGGDFCDRIRPVLSAATEELANLGDGRFVPVEGAGHEIFTTHLDETLTEVRSLLPHE